MSIWMKAKYLGDTVRVLHLRRGDRRGSIRIEQYTEYAFVGWYFSDPDRRRTADQHEWCRSSFGADVVFDRYVQDAYSEGWQNDNG